MTSSRQLVKSKLDVLMSKNGAGAASGAFRGADPYISGRPQSFFCKSAKEGIAETVETAALSGRRNVGAKTVFGTKLELISRQSAAGRLPVRADHK